MHIYSTFYVKWVDSSDSDMMIDDIETWSAHISREFTSGPIYGYGVVCLVN